MKFRKFLEDLGTTSAKQISRFVIGNASVDYDSFFGSIVLAFILTSTTGKLHRPIIDCKRSELGLRFEIEAILERVKIDPSVFHFRQFAKQEYPEGIYSLYDHNIREGISNIEYIVDHHAYSPDKIQASKYLIDTMGSGLTILYYLLSPSKLREIESHEKIDSSFIQKYNDFVKNEPFEELKNINISDRDINQILRFGILIDSFNFDQKLKDRWTLFDKKAVEFIQSQQEFDKGFDWLTSLKFDHARNKKLTLQQSLAKDCKHFTYANKITATYSIIYLHPLEFCSHYQAEMESELTIQQQQADIFCLMAIYQSEDGSFKRQIIYRIKNDHKQRLEQAFQKCLSQTKMIQNGIVRGQWKYWIDPSLTISRKKLEPLLRYSIENIIIA